MLQIVSKTSFKNFDAHRRNVQRLMLIIAVNRFRFKNFLHSLPNKLTNIGITLLLTHLKFYFNIMRRSFPIFTYCISIQLQAKLQLDK